MIIPTTIHIFIGISITIVGTFGICANLLSVIVLLKCKENRNFHRLLAGLAIVDTLLIGDLILEISIVETFMQKEPLWYILAYPYFIHPGRGIIQTSAIFMVVAVATERYRYILYSNLINNFLNATGKVKFSFIH